MRNKKNEIISFSIKNGDLIETEKKAKILVGGQKLLI